MNKELEKSEFLLYSSDNGDVKIEVFLKDENIWLTLNKIAELFETSKQNIIPIIKFNYTFGKIFLRKN